MTQDYSIILASASPRRRELLKQLAVTFKVAPADIDETVIAGETPTNYVLRMSREKALAGLLQNGPELPVMGSDTIVVLNDKIMGKPESQTEAASMLMRLSGQTHHVYSAVALALPPHRVLNTLNITAVTFGKMPKEWIKAYCRSEEPMDKAGAYAVQGGAGQFISRIDGSYSGVMGLPLYETAELLRQVDLLT